MYGKKILLAGFVLQSIALFTHPTTANAATQDCSAINYRSALPVDLAPPWNWFSSTHELQVKAACNGQQVTVSASGNKARTSYVYNTGYVYKNKKWNRLALTCNSGKAAEGVWCRDGASATINGVDRSLSTNLVAAYVCSLVDGQWKCGCKDEACTSPTWQIQGIKPEVVAQSAPVPAQAKPTQTQAQSQGGGHCAAGPSSSFVVNVRDEGAAGNNSADDTAAIQAAINKVGGSGGTVYVPAGTYRINAVKRLLLKSNMTFKMADGATLKAIPNSQDHYALISVQDADNVNVVGGTVIGERNNHSGSDYGQWGMGVEVLASNNVVVDGVTSKDTWGDAFYVGRNASNVTFCAVYADNARRHGMSITEANGVTVKNSKFANTQGRGDSSGGIDVEPDAGDLTQNVSILNSEFVGNASAGIIVGSIEGDGSATKNVTVSGNKVTNNCSDSADPALVIFNTVNATVSNNVVTNNLSDGLVVKHNASGIKVRNNQSSHNKGNGIIVYQASNNEVSNNVANQNGKIGLSIYQATSNVVTNNSGSGNGESGMKEVPKGANSISGNNFD